MIIPPPTKSTVPYFYKYSTLDHPEWLKTIILEHTIYVPTRTQLNDPADGAPRLIRLSNEEMFSVLFEKFLERNPGISADEAAENAAILRYNIPRFGPDETMREMARLIDDHLGDYRVYSMSKRWNNMSLWAKYAANHSGYCLEYENVGPLFESVNDVIYGDSYELDITAPELRDGHFFFCKRMDWSGEEEVRLVVPSGRGDRIKFHDPRWLTRVILGMKMSPEHQSLIRGWAEQRHQRLIVAMAYYDPLDQALKLRQ